MPSEELLASTTAAVAGDEPVVGLVEEPVPAAGGLDELDPQAPAITPIATRPAMLSNLVCRGP
jgi:hypothetical protein